MTSTRARRDALDRGPRASDQWCIIVDDVVWSCCRCSSASSIITAAIPPAVDGAPVELVGGAGAGAIAGGPMGAGPAIGGRASHTQPTLLAMITTDSSGRPMF
jgi:hypothetical protein